MDTIDKRSKLWRNMSDDDKEEYIQLQSEHNANTPKAKAGGARPGAGRKPKISEMALVERLDQIIDNDEAIQTLNTMMNNGEFRALQLYMNYYYGKPKETKDININPEQPLFYLGDED